jgi:cyclase
MIKPRVIPTLLLSNGRLVKTHKFKNAKYVGDPINAIKIFNEKEVDELIIIDIDASRTGKDPDYKLLEKISGECFMPVAYGGGINSIEKARKVFSLGFEKISLQSAVFNTPEFIRSLSKQFGVQSLILSVDIKLDIFGKPRIYNSSKSKILSENFLTFIKNLVKNGIGEVLLNFVDKDGTMSGPNIEIIKKISEAIDVPLIALGGVSSLSDIKSVILAGASAVSAGAFFVFQGPHKAVLISYPRLSELENLFQN